MKAFPTDVEFIPVRPALSIYRQLYTLVNLIIYAVIFGLGAVLFNAQVDPAFWHGITDLPVALMVLYYLGLSILSPSQVRIDGRSQQSDDLFIRSGAISQNYTAVHFLHLPFVNVKQRPLQRKVGLADLTTTSAG